MNLYKTPRPGSPEAIEQGCKCAVLDNHHGAGCMWTHVDGEDVPLFVQSSDCPLHGPATQEESE